MINILISCSEPDFDVGDYPGKIVIDGWIEQDQYAKVLLTQSVPYFAAVDSTSLRKYVITGAKVTVDDGETSEILTLKPNSAYFPPYIYQGNMLKGETGKTYRLTVDFGGQQILATTTIPSLTSLSYSWFQLKEGSDSLGLLYVQFTDDASQINYYRTLTQRKNIDSKYIANYVANYSDAYFNGKEIEIPLFQGNVQGLSTNNPTYYQLGDTIMLKFCAVDQATYDFWYTFQQELINTTNPFASTNARVKTNVTNGLGVWCGYGATYYQVIAR